MRERRSGRWAGRTPTDWRATPIVAQHAPRAAETLWERAVAGEIEGAVVVNLDAPLGARGSKRKLKPADTLDCRLVTVDRKAAVLAAGPLRFSVSARSIRDRDLKPGDAVEVLHRGFYAGGAPREARIVRRRPDLETGVQP